MICPKCQAEMRMVWEYTDTMVVMPPLDVKSRTMVVWHCWPCDFSFCAEPGAKVKWVAKGQWDNWFLGHPGALQGVNFASSDQTRDAKGWKKAKKKIQKFIGAPSRE